MYMSLCVPLQPQSISEKKHYCQKESFFIVQTVSFQAKTMGLYYLFEKTILKKRIWEAWPRLKVYSGPETYSMWRV